MLSNRTPGRLTSVSHTGWYFGSSRSNSCVHLHQHRTSSSHRPLRMKYCRKPLQEREVAIIRNMKKMLKLPVTKIALAVERTKRTVYKSLDPKWTFNTRGRPEALTKKEVPALVRRLKAMITKAKGRTEITLAMLKMSTRCKANLKCIRKNLQERGIRFRRLRQKCLLRKSDITARYLFAQKHKDKSAEW